MILSDRVFIYILLTCYTAIYFEFRTKADTDVLDGTTNPTEDEEEIRTLHREYAGYIIFRKTDYTEIRYLLIKPKWEIEEWILPEGSVHRDETIKQAASRILYTTTNFTTEDIIDIEIEGPIKPDNCTTFFIAYVSNLFKQVTLSAEYFDFKWLTIITATDLADVVSKKVLIQADQILKNMGF